MEEGQTVLDLIFDSYATIRETSILLAAAISESDHPDLVEMLDLVADLTQEVVQYLIRMDSVSSDHVQEWFTENAMEEKSSPVDDESESDPDYVSNCIN